MFQRSSISTVKQIYFCGERGEDMRIMVAVLPSVGSMRRFLDESSGGFGVINLLSSSALRSRKAQTK
jgi:hypothetical protein